MLVLGVLAGAVLLGRDPSAEPAPSEPAPLTATDDVSRADLDAAIGELTRWFEGRRALPSTPLDANLQLLALGRSVLDAPSRGGGPALILANLDALVGSEAGARPASLPAPAPAATGDASPLATLTTLLEAGTPLDRELPLASGSWTLGRLLDLALPGLAARADELDPWALDVLSFGLLAGKKERREELARLAHASLVRLDRQQRRLLGQRGNDAAADGAQERLAAMAPDTADGRRDLELAAAVFRAIAVLGDPPLEREGLRQLNALLYRYQLLSESEGDRFAHAGGDAERTRLHIDALENLGRIEQALYSAHLGFRRSDRPGPAPRTASTMRGAARDIIEHLGALRRAGLLDAEPGATPPPPELSRALAHALRGLRVTRVAT